MKRIYIIATFLSALFLVTSCSPEDKFWNPEVTTTGNVGALFTSMLNNQRMRTEYWHVRTIGAEHSGRFSQTFILPNGQKQYHQTEQYISEYWRDFYTPQYGGPMAMYRQMENVNKSLTEENQAMNEIFFNAGKVVLYDYGSAMVDVFGDIPFSEAGSLHTTSVSTPAKFDNQKDLYKTMIDDLDNINTYFKTATATSAFSRQDILLSGDVAKWRKYANSLRLRLLIRMSYADEAYAKDKVMAMLNDPGNYPLVDGDNNGNYNPKQVDILNTPLLTYDETLKQALSEGASSVAPDFMVNKLMVPTNDVRLSVMFDKNNQPEYIGLPINTPSEEISSLVTKYSCWDSTTLWMNKNIPGVRLTASEVNFIKAEAQQRWGDASKAKTAYETAVKQSVSFYYYLNSIGNNTSGGGFKLEVKPSDDVINKFVTERIAYTGTAEQRLELIGTQKWLHLGWLQSIECWSEYRRTKYPKLLPFPSEAMESGYTQPPTRFQYPVLETSLNPNYSSVQAQDTPNTKIFWDVR